MELVYSASDLGRGAGLQFGPGRRARSTTVIDRYLSGWLAIGRVASGWMLAYEAARFP